MQKYKGLAAARFTLADLIAGGRMLLLPAVVVAVLVAAGHLFHDASAEGDGDALSTIPREAWVWAFIAYVALILPRRPLQLSVPGLPPLAKAAVATVAGICFLLELRFAGQVEPLLGLLLAGAATAAAAVATGLMLRAERNQPQDGEQARDQLLHQLILEYEKLNQGTPDPAVTHPALFAEVAGIVRSGSALGTSIWFLRPHPALGHRRPIDVLRDPGGEARLLQACRLGPNL